EQYRARQRMPAQDQPVHAVRDPTMPPAVVEWFEQRAARRHEDDMAGLSEVFAVGSVEELEALSAEEMAIRWLAYNDPEASLRRDLERQLHEQDPAFAGRIDPERVPLPRWRYRVLGGVREVETEVYVLYRVVHEHEGAAPSFGDIGIVPVTAAAGGWRLRADPMHLSVGGPNTMSVVGFHLGPRRSAFLQREWFGLTNAKRARALSAPGPVRVPDRGRLTSPRRLLPRPADSSRWGSSPRTRRSGCPPPRRAAPTRRALRSPSSAGPGTWAAQVPSSPRAGSRTRSRRSGASRPPAARTSTPRAGARRAARRRRSARACRSAGPGRPARTPCTP